MGLADRLRESGFKPEANQDGEWTPYNGTYRCQWKTLRLDFDEKNQCDYVQAEFEIEEVLTGDMKRDSKFPAFRKRYYVDFNSPTEDHLANAKDISNKVFTSTGIELNFNSKEEFKASAEQVIGQNAYIRAWGFAFEKDREGNPIPEDQRKANQFFTVIKKSVGEKKRSQQSMAF